MPKLAFSPAPQQPALEKENASSPPPISSSGGGINKKIAGDIGHSSTGSVGRSPLESLTAAPTSGVGVIKCKRDSTCKCPDCDMAASVFGIDELRQVGGGGGIPNSPGATALSPPPTSGGGLVRSPLPGNGVGDNSTVEPDADTAPSSPLVDDTPPEVGTQQQAAVAPPSPSPVAVTASPVPAAPLTPTSTLSYSAGNDEMPSKAKETLTMPSPRSAAAASVEDTAPGVVEEQQLGQDVAEEWVPGVAVETAGDRGGTPAPAQRTAAAEDGGSKKKAGWGFRMARAVFSPMSPKRGICRDGNGSRIGSSNSGVTTTAFAGELEVEANAAVSAASVAPESSETGAATTATGPAFAAAADGEIPMSKAGVTDADNGSNVGTKTGEVIGYEDDLLSDDDLNKGEDKAKEGEGPVEHEEGDAAAAAVVRGTCRPPLLPGKNGNKENGDGGGGGNLGEKDVAATVAAGAGAPFLDVVLGKGASRKRSSSGRRLSKDVFYECSSEVRKLRRMVRAPRTY